MTQIEFTPPFSVTCAFFNSGTQVPAKCQLIDNGAREDIIRRKAYMKTPTPKKIAGKSTVKSGRAKGASCITTPEKAKISRHFQSLGGESVRGAAAETARKFKLNKSKGMTLVKKYDREIRVIVWHRVQIAGLRDVPKNLTRAWKRESSMLGLTMSPGPTAKWRKISAYHVPRCIHGWCNEDCVV